MSNFFLESTHDSSKKIARVSAVISANQQEIFALLADPAQHATIDGSGSVKSSREEHPQRLELGTKFGMAMKVGVPYRITNEVVEFIEDQGLDFHLGNAVKYISRAGKKDPSKTVQDLKKAVWYIKRQIELEVAKSENRDPVRPNNMKKD